MAGNSIGQIFRLTTFGESHGPALGAIVDGCPPGLRLSEADLQPELDRRRPGQSRYTTQRREPDQVRILSGVFEGRTTGTSIGLLIENVDQRSHDYGEIARSFRPGHADLPYHLKYGHRDYRGGGRSSARETAMRVAAGAIARKWLAGQGVRIRGYLAGMGPIRCPDPGHPGFDWAEVEHNDFFAPDAGQVPAMIELIEQLRRDGDSVGARVSVVAEGVPAGLGEPVFGRLDAELAAALMGINAVKMVAVGDGESCVAATGAAFRDELSPEGFLSNHAGGILGGISTGQPVVTHVHLKPTSSIRVPGRSLDVEGQAIEVVTKGRHDPCVGIRAVPIAEAMVALVLMDHWLRHRAQNADVRTPEWWPPRPSARPAP